MPSSSTTVEAPPAVKKRGRPKKVIAEDAGKPVVAEAKKTATVKKATAKVVAAKEKVVEPKKEKKTVAKKVAPVQPMPTTPATSKILEEVRAKGTLKKILPTQPTKTEGVAEDVSKTTATVQSKPASSPASSEPNNPVAPPIPNPQTPLTKNSLPTTQQQQQQQPEPPRTSTISLPRKPLPAPSPLHQATIRTSPRPQHAPLPSSSLYPSSYTQRRTPGQSPYQNTNTRIIEPTFDTSLPPKYKPAARRVNAIIVGLPFVIVLGYELWARYTGRKEQKKLFTEDGQLTLDLTDLGKESRRRAEEERKKKNDE